MTQYTDRYMNEFMQSRHYTIWQLIKSYWQSDQRFLAYVFFAVVMVLTVSLVSLDVTYNYWYYYFYYTLYNAPAVLRFFIVAVLLAASYILVGFYRYYLAPYIGLRWVTEKCIGCLLQRRGYFLAKNSASHSATDANELVNYSIDLSLRLLGGITTFIFFMYILWQLSADLNIPIGKLGVLHIPYYPMWVGVIYTFLGAYFTFKLGRPLISFKIDAATEQSAKKHHSRVKRSSLSKFFSNRLLVNLRQLVLRWLSKWYNQAILLLPLFIVWPNFFDKVYLFGGLIQCLHILGRIQESLSKMVNSYKHIAQLQETDKLQLFLAHANRTKRKTKKVTFSKQRKSRLNLAKV